MKFNDNITLDIARAVSDVLEGKVKKEEVKYPHKMYHPETGEEVEVMDKAEHDKYNAKGYVHEKPKNESPEEPRAKGEKDFKDKHVVKKSGEKEDGTVMKEDSKEEPEGISKEESEKQKKYQAFFNKALKKFGVKSPAELEGDKKKEFFDYVDANYEADNETDEDVNEVLGAIKKVAKKAVDKIKGKKEKPKSGNPVDMKALLNQPGQIKAQIKELEKKLAATSAKFKKAQDDGDEEREDYWGGIEVSQAMELDKLKDKFKKAMKDKGE
jgi:hypothetical protein